MQTKDLNHLNSAVCMQKLWVNINFPRLQSYRLKGEGGTGFLTTSNSSITSGDDLT
jgi:hypothetical protein